MSGSARSTLWAFGLPVVMLPAYWIGEDKFIASCSGGDCDMASVAGLSWAALAALAYVAVACAIELMRAAWHAKRPTGSPAPRQEGNSQTIWP